MSNTNRIRDKDANSLQMSMNKTSDLSAIGETKRLKVQFIQNNPNAQPNNFNLQINPKIFPNLKVNDILEISSINPNLNRSTNPVNSTSNQASGNDDESSPILLQVVSASLNELIHADSIRIDQIASSAPFSFKAFTYVYVTVVDKSSVVLDLVELLFREQYLNGNDMLRIKKYMINSCVYLKKNIEFCGMRCSVRQMWAPNGDIVTCGYISEKTRLVFRSQSAMCTIYIQMSREMWEFDVNGEMYHEKAVNFLGELFANWKNQSCTHDVTIALFSRIFYDAKSLEDFPSSISRHVKKDHKNRFYEDFYRVIYQNERFEDWTPTLVILKRLIKEYRDYILNYHKRQFGSSLKMPTGLLSSAAVGNFLETLILSSNVFERHFIDRPFDRTGMMSLVITPGNGLFEVSRELSKITKERVIDNAIGSDLVCLGEQPLHSVPLFKYETPDTYDIPHWINLSFYKSSETVRFCNSKFLPSSKIKIKYKSGLGDSSSILPDYHPDKNNYLKSLEETDNIFENLPPKVYSQELLNSTASKPKPTSRISTVPSFPSSNSLSNQNGSLNRSQLKNRRNQSNFNNITNYNEQTTSKRTLSTCQQEEPKMSSNQTGDITTDNDDDSSLELDSDNEQNEAANGVRRTKSKVNPFAPSSLEPKMSFERRRWAHTFPLRSDGTPIYQHWISVQANNDHHTFAPSSFSSNSINYNNYQSEINFDLNKVSPDSNKLPRAKGYDINGTLPSKQELINKNRDLKNNFNWEIVHKDESKAFMRPGVAWKSLTTPACLPLTTDFFPNQKTLGVSISQSSNYSLLLDDIRDQYGYNNYHYNKISMEQVFYELVGHRLAMGFQMVVPKETFTYPTNNNGSQSALKESTSNTINQNANNHFICDLAASTSVTARTQLNSIKGYYKLSLGRTYHELFYIVDKANTCDYIKVEIYMPYQKESKEDKEKENLYTYRFQVPDSKTYDISYVKMTRKNTESIAWNKIDSYICIQGNGSLTPSELKKCWRQRIYLIPILYTSSSKIQAKSNPPIHFSSNQSSSNSISDQIQPTSPNSLGIRGSFNNQFDYGSSSSHFIFNIQTPGMVPASMAEIQEHPVYCDIYQRKSDDELKFYRDYYFIKFMEGLNKLNRADDRRCYSRATINYSEMINNNPPDQCIAISLLQSLLSNNNPSTSIQSIATTNSSNKLSLNNSNVNIANKMGQAIPCLAQKQITFKKLTSPKLKLYSMVNKYLEQPVQNDALMKTEIYNYLNQEYIPDIINKVHGVPFIENKKDIPLNCFISAEAVWWCIEHITDIETELDAIVFMQIMCDFDLIKHISNQQKVFIHGFCLYYIITPESCGDHLYTKDYCEVGFCDLDCMRSNKSHRVNDTSHDLKASLPLAANEIFKSYLSIFKGYSKSEFASDSILKLVNVDVDPAHKSNRVEWASAVYRSNYHQLCAFELEIQWEMATGQLLSELASGWGKLANRFNYHIVAAPIDPFALPIVQNSDPLRGPIIIKLNIACLIQNESCLFESYIDQKYKLDYSLLMNDKNESGKFPSSIPAAILVDQLAEQNPEFMEYLLKKYSDDNLSKCRDKIERKIHEESDFIEQEFQEFVERKRIFRLQFFQEAILEKFGFVKNASVVKALYNDDDPTFFIHSSGGMFVCLPNYYGNYYTSRSRHTSSNSTNSITTTTTASTVSKTLINCSKLNEFEKTRELVAKSDEIANSPSIISNLETKYTNSRSDLQSKSNSNGYNSSMSHSYTMTNQTNNNTGVYARERSNTKSQHVQFLKLNEKNYLTNGTSTNQDSDSSTHSSERKPSTISIQSTCTVDSLITAVGKKSSKTEDEIKKDLLFKPITAAGYDVRQSAKSNEKLELVQQQQREQMLLQSLSTTPNNSTNSLGDAYQSNQFSSDLNADFSFVNSDESKENKKLPFYAEPDTYIGFSWSWNFMLGKKWRSQYTGDESFQDNMLSDFRVFCANKDGRLLKFYNECKDLLN